MQKIEQTQAEYDFMMEALTEKFQNMIKMFSRVNDEPEDGPTHVTLNESQYRAMKESGIWDDPVKRANVLKMYAERQRLDSIDDAFDFAYEQFKEEQKKAPKRRGRPPVKKTVTRRRNVK